MAGSLPVLVLQCMRTEEGIMLSRLGLFTECVHLPLEVEAHIVLGRNVPRDSASVPLVVVQPAESMSHMPTSLCQPARRGGECCYLIRNSSRSPSRTSHGHGRSLCHLPSEGLV